MATAKKASAKTTASKTAVAKAKPAAKKTTAPKSRSADTKKMSPAATKKATPKTAAVPAAKVAAPKAPKELLGKTALTAHVAAVAGVDTKVAKSVLAALETTMLSSLGKKAAGGFVLPGLFKVTVQKVPARKAYKGIDRFTKEERTFPAKPASTKIRLRAMKKLKDAAAV
jgi:hypothetical protein